jgi:hypothetical protein
VNWYEDIYIQTYVTAAAIIVGAIFLRRLLLVYWVVWGILWANVIVDVYTTYLAFNSLNTLPYNNILMLSEGMVIILLYYIHSPFTTGKRILLYLSLIYLIFSIINFVFIQGEDNLNTYSIMPCGLVIAILSYLNIRMFITSETFFKSLLFWFSVANFIYFIVVIPSLSFLPIANNISYELGASLKVINDTAYILWSLIISIGFICQKKRAI